jgi:hypothetical protein
MGKGLTSSKIDAILKVLVPLGKKLAIVPIEYEQRLQNLGARATPEVLNLWFELQKEDDN